MTTHEYYLAHRERILAKCKEYRRTHPEVLRAYRVAHPRRSTLQSHRQGTSRPMSKAIDCAAYLGIYIAEKALSRFFGTIERMPTNNPGYDFLCGKGYKIDAKSSCLRERTPSPSRWLFAIRKNQVADYFLCLGFDNRESLRPMHVWLLPGELVNNLMNLSITNNSKGLARYSKYERPLDRVISCCNQMKGVISA